jgi:3-methyladenine DNA glycosylase AlkD
MDADEVLTTLKALGKPQTAAIYQRHGSGDNVFGVLTSELQKLKKKIKVDHALALELWDTGNAEARIVALLIADPTQISRTDAETWIQSSPVRFLGSYLADFFARGPLADALMRHWMKSKDECPRELSYSILGSRLRNDPESISDENARNILTAIEQQLQQSPNWVRYAMNSALIAIGVFKPALRAEAIAAAQRIGKVEVDHGLTNCKTPDAAAYIEKTSQRKRL